MSNHQFNPRIALQDGPIPEKLDPADANLSWLWIRDVLTPLGLTVLVVETTVNPQANNWPHVGNLVSAELEKCGHGYFDSMHMGETTRWWFLVPAAAIAEALTETKNCLTAWKLIGSVKIGHADAEAGAWRTFHPGLGN